MTPPPLPPQVWEFYSAAHRPTTPPTWLGNAGGVSGSDLWRVGSAAGLLLLRAWPVDGPDPGRLGRIHRWLRRLAPLTVVPAPIAGRAGPTWAAAAGRLWELTRWLPGTADLGWPPAPAHLATMFATLARVHLLLAAGSARDLSPGLIARRDELRQLAAGEFDRLGRVIEAAPPTEARALAREWLDRASRVADEVADQLAAAARQVIPLQPVLRDVRPDHFLFEEDRLTGLVDFGAMGVDAAAGDLARLLGETVGRDRGARAAGLAAYQQVRPLTGADRELIARFEAANAVLGGARWVRWHFVAGRQFGAPEVVTNGLSRALRRLVAWSESAG